MPVVPDEPSASVNDVVTADSRVAEPRTARRRRGRRRRGRRASAPGQSQVPGRVIAAARRLGFTRLRPEQERIISNALAGRDVLGVLPTGFGKSACYQIPSMILP